MLIDACFPKKYYITKHIFEKLQTGVLAISLDLLLTSMMYNCPPTFFLEWSSNKNTINVVLKLIIGWMMVDLFLYDKIRGAQNWKSDIIG